jgi:zinc protease
VDWGTFGLYFTPRPGADLAAGEAAMRAEIAKLLAHGVTDEEVEEAKMRLRAGVIYARDGLQGAANTLGMALATGGTLDQVEYWPSHIAEVTTAQVMEAARTVLGPDTASAVGVLLPEQTEQTAAPGEKP